MIIEVPPGTKYFQLYSGWYITSSKELAYQWERENATPNSSDYMLVYMKEYDNYTQECTFWAYKPRVENEFGVECP